MNETDQKNQGTEIIVSQRTQKQGLKEVLRGFLPLQQRYLTALAFNKDEGQAMNFIDLPESLIISWKMDERFRGALQSVYDGEYAPEAIKIWTQGRLLEYMGQLDRLALGAQSEKVQLEALKHMVMLAGGEEKTHQEFTSIEEYILNSGGKQTVERKISN
jgi:hypothetical protein